VLHLAARYPGAFFTDAEVLRRCCTDTWPSSGGGESASCSTRDLDEGVEAVSVEDVGLACELADRYGSRLAARDLLHVMLRTGAAKAVTADKDFDELSSSGLVVSTRRTSGYGAARPRVEPGPQRHAKLPARVALPVLREEVMIRVGDGELLLSVSSRSRDISSGCIIGLSFALLKGERGGLARLYTRTRRFWWANPSLRVRAFGRVHTRLLAAGWTEEQVLDNYLRLP